MKIYGLLLLYAFFGAVGGQVSSCVSSLVTPRRAVVSNSIVVNVDMSSARGVANMIVVQLLSEILSVPVDVKISSSSLSIPNGCTNPSCSTVDYELMVDNDDFSYFPSLSPAGTLSVSSQHQFVLSTQVIRSAMSASTSIQLTDYTTWNSTVLSAYFMRTSSSFFSSHTLSTCVAPTTSSPGAYFDHQAFFDLGFACHPTSNIWLSPSCAASSGTSNLLFTGRNTAQTSDSLSVSTDCATAVVFASTSVTPLSNVLATGFFAFAVVARDSFLSDYSSELSSASSTDYGILVPNSFPILIPLPFETSPVTVESGIVASRPFTKMASSVLANSSHTQKLLAKLDLTTTNIITLQAALTTQVAQNSSATDLNKISTAACNWLKANPSAWTPWFDSSCPSGSEPEIDSSGYWTGTCTPCAVGYASSDGSKCLMCPSGSFSSQTNSSTCVACGRGSYQPSIGQSACLACPFDTYMDAEGSATCVACPDGAKTPTTASVSSQSCACPEGKHGLLVNGVLQCSSCVHGLKCGIGTISVEPGYWAIRKIDSPLRGAAQLPDPVICDDGVCQAPLVAVTHNSSRRRLQLTDETDGDALEMKMSLENAAIDELLYGGSISETHRRLDLLFTFSTTTTTSTSTTYATTTPTTISSSSTQTSSSSVTYERAEIIYSFQPEEVDVFMCATRDSCPGGPLNVCAPNRQSYGCGDCRDGYFRPPGAREGCSKCESGKKIAAPFVMIIGYLIIAFILLFVCSAARSQPKQSLRMLSALCLAGSTLQALTVVSQTPINWPEAADVIFIFSAAASMDSFASWLTCFKVFKNPAPGLALRLARVVLLPLTIFCVAYFSKVFVRLYKKKNGITTDSSSRPSSIKINQGEKPSTNGDEESTQISDILLNNNQQQQDQQMIVQSPLAHHSGAASVISFHGGDQIHHSIFNNDMINNKNYPIQNESNDNQNNNNNNNDNIVAGNTNQMPKENNNQLRNESSNNFMNGAGATHAAADDSFGSRVRAVIVTSDGFSRSATVDAMCVAVSFQAVGILRIAFQMLSCAPNPTSEFKSVIAMPHIICSSDGWKKALPLAIIIGAIAALGTLVGTYLIIKKIPKVVNSKPEYADCFRFVLYRYRPTFLSFNIVVIVRNFALILPQLLLTSGRTSQMSGFLLIGAIYQGCLVFMKPWADVSTQRIDAGFAVLFVLICVSGVLNHAAFVADDTSSQTTLNALAYIILSLLIMLTFFSIMIPLIALVKSFLIPYHLRNKLDFWLRATKRISPKNSNVNDRNARESRKRRGKRNFIDQSNQKVDEAIEAPSPSNLHRRRPNMATDVNQEQDFEVTKELMKRARKRAEINFFTREMHALTTIPTPLLHSAVRSLPYFDRVAAIDGISALTNQLFTETGIRNIAEGSHLASQTPVSLNQVWPHAIDPAPRAVKEELTKQLTDEIIKSCINKALGITNPSGNERDRNNNNDADDASSIQMTCAHSNVGGAQVFTTENHISKYSSDNRNLVPKIPDRPPLELPPSTEPITDSAEETLLFAHLVNYVDRNVTSIGNSLSAAVKEGVCTKSQVDVCAEFFSKGLVSIGVRNPAAMANVLTTIGAKSAKNEQSFYHGSIPPAMKAALEAIRTQRLREEEEKEMLRNAKFAQQLGVNDVSQFIPSNERILSHLLSNNNNNNSTDMPIPSPAESTDEFKMTGINEHDNRDYFHFAQDCIIATTTPKITQSHNLGVGGGDTCRNRRNPAMSPNNLQQIGHPLNPVFAPLINVLEIGKHGNQQHQSSDNSLNDNNSGNHLRPDQASSRTPPESIIRQVARASYSRERSQSNHRERERPNHFNERGRNASGYSIYPEEGSSLASSSPQSSYRRRSRSRKQESRNLSSGRGSGERRTSSRRRGELSSPSQRDSNSTERRRSSGRR